MMPITGTNLAMAKPTMAINDPKVFNYIEEILQAVGTTVKQETKSGDVLVTTNTLTATDEHTYMLSTTTAVNGEVANDEDFTIIDNKDGTYRLINTDRGVDYTFKNDSMTTRDYASQSMSSAIIRLSDSSHAEDDEVVGLSDSYNYCGHARFDAGVDTADDTFIEWDASNHFWSYCFVYQGFDYVKVSHEGHHHILNDNESSTNMSNSNGAGTYTVRVSIHYD